MKRGRDGTSILQDLDSFLHNYKNFEQEEDKNICSFLKQTLESVRKNGPSGAKPLEIPLQESQNENSVLQRKLHIARNLVDTEQARSKLLRKHIVETEWKIEQCLDMIKKGDTTAATRCLEHVLGFFEGKNESFSEDKENSYNDPSETIGSILTGSDLDLTVEELEGEEDENENEVAAMSTVGKILRSMNSLRSSFSRKGNRLRSSFSGRESKKRKSTNNLTSSKNKIAKVDIKDDVSGNDSVNTSNSSSNTVVEVDCGSEAALLDLESCDVVNGGNVAPFTSSFRDINEVPDFGVDEIVISSSPRPSSNETFTLQSPRIDLPNISDFILNRRSMRTHHFITKAVFSEDCNECGRRFQFGKYAYKCTDCKALCHNKCRSALPVPCIPIVASPGGLRKGLTISDFAPTTKPMVPALIVHCVNEIETRGLNVIGIYRVSGLERDIRLIRDRFMEGKYLPRLEKIDIHSICGAIKSFLRKLREPVIPLGKWKDFITATYEKDVEDAMPLLFEAFFDLPEPNRDTLAFLILHLQRIAEVEEIKMPVENLATVLGPTLVGYSVPNATDYTIMMQETVLQKRVIELLLEVPSDYWKAFLEPHLREYEIPQRRLKFRR